MAKIAHLFLAAGASRRMGSPKQLLLWKNQPLISYQIGLRLQTQEELIVVLGAYADQVLPLIEHLPIIIAINHQWAEGMGTSIAHGVKTVMQQQSDLDGLLVSLLDQPLVTVAHLEKLVQLFQPEKQQIIASQADSGWQGVPALFDRFYLEELSQLKGEKGAKKIIQKYPKAVTSIACNELLADMDTPEAYRALVGKAN